MKAVGRQSGPSQWSAAQQRSLDEPQPSDTPVPSSRDRSDSAKAKRQIWPVRRCPVSHQQRAERTATLPEDRGVKTLPRGTYGQREWPLVQNSFQLQRVSHWQGDIFIVVSMHPHLSCHPLLTQGKRCPGRSGCPPPCCIGGIHPASASPFSSGTYKYGDFMQTAPCLDLHS